MIRFLFCLLSGLPGPTAQAAEPSLIEHLTIFLTGTFTNEDQARGDQNFRNVTLHVAPVWTSRSDGPWLYLEQSLKGAETHPYRQVVYQLAPRAGNILEMRVFELTDPIAATGAWKDPARFDRLSSSNLAAREECMIILRLQPDGSFKGGTEGKACASALRGASYATTEATITNREVTFWERGYNAAGTQVWGSIHGGHMFKRIE